MAKNNFTMNDLRNSKVAKLNPHVFAKGGRSGGKTHNVTVSRETESSRAKEWISWNLPYWCNEKGLIMETEFVFHPTRKWRFDYCIQSLKIAIEYEGIFSAKSRHTTHQGYTGDIEKYNAAVALGWRVLRFTAGTYKTMLTELNKIV